MELELSKNYTLIKELAWAIEIALIDAAQRFGSEFVSRATLALSKAQRAAIYRLHLLSIASAHGKETARKVEEAEKRGFQIGENPVLDEVLRKEAREKAKTAKSNKDKTTVEGEKQRRGGYCLLYTSPSPRDRG